MEFLLATWALSSLDTFVPDRKEELALESHCIELRFLDFPGSLDISVQGEVGGRVTEVELSDPSLTSGLVSEVGPRVDIILKCNDSKM